MTQLVGGPHDGRTFQGLKGTWLDFPFGPIGYTWDEETGWRMVFGNHRYERQGDEYVYIGEIRPAVERPCDGAEFHP